MSQPKSKPMGYTGGEFGARLFAFQAAVEGCCSLAALRALTLAACGAAVMEVFASVMLTGPKAGTPGRVHFHSFAEAWADAYLTGGSGADNPLLRWGLLSGAPARWSRIAGTVSVSDVAHPVWRALRLLGWSEGVAVPVRTGSGDLGLALAGTAAPMIGAELFRYVSLVGQTVLFRAEELGGGVARAPLQFSQRERECVSLLMQGLTEREISARLGIRDVTARFHIDNARQKAGARSRTHLAAIAGNWLGPEPEAPLDFER